jgi:hypothetical protein
MSSIGGSDDTNFYSETINIIRNYKILNAIDPFSGIVYNTNDINELSLIDFNNSVFKIPSNGELISLNIAIQNGYLEVILVNESMESFCEYITYKVEVEVLNFILLIYLLV